ncbi:MAG: tail fiber domain-containing protein, partial [Geminicoccaceae bacterium]
GRFTTLRASYVSHTIRFGQNADDQPGSGNSILGGAMNWDATAGTGGASLFVSKGQYWSLLLNNNTGGGDTIQLFCLGGTVKSAVAIDSTGITISSCTATPPSDYRLKDVLGPVENATALLLSLNPLWYRWKHTAQRDIGFLAHAVQAVLPCAATGKKDDVWDEAGPRGPDGRLLNAPGEMRPQTWKPDRLIPLLTAGFQEHERRLAKVEALEQEVAELRATIERLGEGERTNARLATG